MKQVMKDVLQNYSLGVFSDADALRALHMDNLGELLEAVDRAGYERPERHRPPKEQSEIERATEAAWMDLMTPPELEMGDPKIVGPVDGEPLWVGDVPGFLRQAEISLRHNLTAFNLRWWRQRAFEESYRNGSAPGFGRFLTIEGILYDFARETADWRC